MTPHPELNFRFPWRMSLTPLFHCHLVLYESDYGWAFISPLGYLGTNIYLFLPILRHPEVFLNLSLNKSDKSNVTRNNFQYEHHISLSGFLYLLVLTFPIYFVSYQKLYYQNHIQNTWTQTKLSQDFQ